MYTFRPHPQVSAFVWKQSFFSPFSKKFVSTWSIFESFSPIHKKTLNQFENVNYRSGSMRMAPFSSFHMSVFIREPENLQGNSLKISQSGQKQARSRQKSTLTRLFWQMRKWSCFLKSQSNIKSLRPRKMPIRNHARQSTPIFWIFL